ncbi:MAG TPA: ATPase, T2SS/T4P/T4SS family, partial [Vulgatibacter sp.]|nr:ATPase, T2SS/T4P/T4SS family [Vulgatibacter sp.]
ALTAAETGHLVMSTLHTVDATETINRIISVFPPHQQKQIRLQLASVLRAVISQRLVPRADGKGRVAAVEVMICTSRVRELNEDKDRTKEIADAIAQGHDTYGTQTFDQSLMALLRAGHITHEEALRQASNPDDFALRLSGIASTSDSKWDSFEDVRRESAEKASKPAPLTPRGPPPAGAARLASISPLKQPAPAAAPPSPPPVPAAPSDDDDFQIERF